MMVVNIFNDSSMYIKMFLFFQFISPVFKLRQTNAFYIRSNPAFLRNSTHPVFLMEHNNGYSLFLLHKYTENTENAFRRNAGWVGNQHPSIRSVGTQGNLELERVDSRGYTGNYLQ